jgi:hypothetical protein
VLICVFKGTYLRLTGLSNRIIRGEIPRESLEVAGPITVRAVLDALEARYPVLRGTIRDHVTLKRRPFIRFFACKEDLSLEPPEAPLPDAIANGAEPFLIIGAMAGG